MQNIVILGSGLSGLSCAYHLKKKYSIFDQNKDAGGLTRSFKKKGFIFDLDGHLLHLNRKYTKKLIFDLLGSNLIHHKRNSYVYFKDKYVEYPFQARILDLPEDISKECLSGFYQAKKAKKESCDFQEWIINTFGRGTAKHFFLPYNKKFWKYPLKNISTNWINNYIPVIDKISKKQKDFGYNVDFWYPESGGISCLAESLKKRIKPVNYSKKVKKIDLKDKKIFFSDKSFVKYKTIVTSIPLPEMMNIVRPIPLEIKSLFNKLNHNSIYVFNIGLKKKLNHKIHWIYFPERKFPFYRIGFYSNFSNNMAESGCASIYVETSYSKTSYFDKNKLKENVIKKLKNLKIIDTYKDIKVIYPVDIKYGYIIYDFNYNDCVFPLLDFLKNNNIFSIGRYGSWSYKSMEDVILDGRNTALFLNKQYG